MRVLYNDKVDGLTVMAVANAYKSSIDGALCTLSFDDVLDDGSWVEVRDISTTAADNMLIDLYTRGMLDLRSYDVHNGDEDDEEDE